MVARAGSEPLTTGDWDRIKASGPVPSLCCTPYSASVSAHQYCLLRFHTCSVMAWETARLGAWNMATVRQTG